MPGAGYQGFLRGGTPGPFLLHHQFHHDAGLLAKAARKNDDELISFYFSKLVDSCSGCHSQHARHKFPDFDKPNNLRLTDRQQVIAAQQEWIDAEVNHDEAVLNRVLDERFVLNSSSGGPVGKAEVIESVLNWPLVSQTLSDQTVLIDSNTAIVMGIAHFTVAVDGNENKTSAARYITTYIKRKGQWRALALQMNSIDSEVAITVCDI